MQLQEQNKTRQYPIWKAIFMSFYSRDLYRDVVKNWKGFGIGYIFALSTLMCLLMVFTWLNVLYRVDITQIADDTTQSLFEDPNLSFEENLNRFLNIVGQIPKITIINGEAEIEGNAPYFITDPVSGRKMAIIDTTGKYTSLDNEEAFILVSKNHLVTKDKDGQELYDFSELQKSSSMEEKDINRFFGIISQIPLITIKGGAASIAENSPYYIYGKDEKVLAIIDINGEATLDNSDAYMLLTKDSLLLKNPLKSDVVQVRLSEIDADMIFEALEYSLLSLRTVFTWILFLFVTPIFIVASAIMLGFLVSLYSFAAMAVMIITKMRKLDFPSIYRLSAVAITPVALLNMAIPQVFGNQGLIYFLIALGYIYFALKANSEMQ